MEQLDLLPGSEIETSKILITNKALKELPKVEYSPINERGPGEEGNDPREVLFAGCECGQLKCDANHCPCIQRFGPNYNHQGRLWEERSKYPSSSSLDDVFDKPIYECNSSCLCGHECSNRVVGNGIQIRLEVFLTDKGRSLRTLENIARNQFVCEYAGEVLTEEEARRRTKLLGQDDMSYVYVLKEHTVSKGTVVTTYIDPTLKGNVSRYFNHSCDPNLFVVPVRIDNEIPRLGLFARRDIQSGEELNYDYSGGELKQFKAVSRTSADIEENSNYLKVCLCGTLECRKYFPFKPLFD